MSNRKWISRNPEEAVAKSRRWQKRNPEKVRAINREQSYRYRAAVLDHYGPFCVCCGEAETTFLTVDHMNNDGAEHRRTDPSASNIYFWLVRNDFPEGFQILCWNCNAAKQFRGGCPHQRFNVFTDLRDSESIAALGM
jgi:hypothetical protein